MSSIATRILCNASTAVTAVAAVGFGFGVSVFVSPVAQAAPLAEVYVDAAWAGTLPGTDPDGAGPATDFGADSFATINSALAVRPVKVSIAAGTYSEQVVITSDVELAGAGADQTIIANPGPLAEIGGWNPLVAVIAADANIHGVTVAGPQVLGETALSVGVLVITGGHLDLRDSKIIDIADTVFSGAQRGVGLLVGNTGDPATAHVEGNTFLRYQKVGIVVRAGSHADIIDNIVQGRGLQSVIGANGIQFQGAGTIVGNTIVDNADTFASDGYGLKIISPTGPVTITGNTVARNEVQVTFATTGSGPVLVSGNRIGGLRGTLPAVNTTGFYVGGNAAGVTITGNTVTGNTLGVDIDGTNATFTSNILEGNDAAAQFDGSAAFAANRIVDNTAGINGVGTGGSAGPNWWGCNTGPSTPGCDTITGSYAEPEWLVLTTELAECAVVESESLVVNAAINTTNSGAAYSAATIPPTLVSVITAVGGSASIASGTTSDGLLAFTFTAGQPGPASVSVTADAATANTNDAACGPITISAAPNSAPVANAGPSQTVASGATVTLTAAASSDPDANALTYAWVQTSGPAVTLSDAAAVSPTFAAPTGPATITFELTVSDGTLSSSARTTVTVNAAPTVNHPPTLPATVPPAAVTGPSSGTLAATDADGDTLSYRAVGTQPGFVLNADGTYTFTPDETMVGVVTFNYEVCDAVSCTEGTISFEVAPPAPTTTVPAQPHPPTPTTASPAGLPATGSSPLTLSVIALMFVSAGAALVVGRRRSV